MLGSFYRCTSSSRVTLKYVELLHTRNEDNVPRKLGLMTPVPQFVDSCAARGTLDLDGSELRSGAWAKTALPVARGRY